MHGRFRTQHCLPTHLDLTIDCIEALMALVLVKGEATIMIHIYLRFLIGYQVNM